MDSLVIARPEGSFDGRPEACGSTFVLITGSFNLLFALTPLA